MSTWEPESFYYSGQGVVLAGKRGVDGKPLGLIPFGNVSDLKLGLALTNLEHKESQTGQRATDLRLTTETKATLTMTVENFIAANLASALRASVDEVVGASVTDAVMKAYPGKVTPFEHIKVSAVTAKVATVAMTPFSNATTPYDFKVNMDSGSIQWNDGSIVAMDKLGVVVTAVTVGATTQITVPNNLTAGSKVSLRGFTGADAGDLNGKTFTVSSANGTSFVIPLVTTAKVITVAASTFATWDGMPATVSYTYVDQNLVNAMTESSQELYLRFEGLNTADGNNPVVVDVFKFSTDPLKELSLIGDGVGQFVLEGNVLADSLRATGSKFFAQRMLR